MPGQAVVEFPWPPATPNIDFLALIADSVICTDDHGRVLIFNRAAELSFGYAASEVIGQPVEMLLPHGDRSKHVAQVRDFSLEGGMPNRLMGRQREVRGRRKNGEEFPAEAMVSRQTIDGKTILTVVHRDISDRKELEELRDAAAHELDHRLKNVLSVVNALVTLTAASAASVDDFKESLTGRLAALAKTQTSLLGKQQSTSLGALFLAELEQYRGAVGANVTVEGPLISIGPRAAQMLALAVHELATNSSKYGALSAGGHVGVTYAYDGGVAKDTLAVRWEEKGGPVVKPPTRHGFGTSLITQVMPRALHGSVTMAYRPDGLVCDIAIPRATIEFEH